MIEGYKKSLQTMSIFNKEELQALTFEMPEAPNIQTLSFCGDTLTLNWNQCLTRLVAVASTLNFKTIQPQLKCLEISSKALNKGIVENCP